MAYVQDWTNNGTTNSLTLSATPSNAGATLVAIGGYGSSNGVSSPGMSDNVGGAYTQVGAATHDTVNNVWLGIFILENVTTAARTITWAPGNSGSCRMWVIEMTAPGTWTANSSAVAGQVQAAPGGTSNALTTGATTGTGSLIGVCCDSSNVGATYDPSAGTGFTSARTGTDSAVGSWCLEYAAGQTNAAATWTANTGSGTDRYDSIAIVVPEPGTNQSVTPGTGTITLSAVASTVTLGINTVVTPFVARRSGIVVPRDYDRIVAYRDIPRSLRAA